jgi:serine/threonine protein kinase
VAHQPFYRAILRDSDGRQNARQVPIVEKIGRGGMGVVYRGVDETLDRQVAIKAISPELVEDDLVRRFRAEAVTLARVNHPNIATVFELFRDDDRLLMVMELVSGQTFEPLIDRTAPMAGERARSLTGQMLDALSHAHRAGIVHRDLKPANLMLTDGGGATLEIPRPPEGNIFARGPRLWVTIETADDRLVLRIEPQKIRPLLDIVAQRTKASVERQMEPEL